MNGQVAKKLRKAVGYVPRKSNIRLKRMYNILKQIHQELPHHERAEFLTQIK